MRLLRLLALLLVLVLLFPAAGSARKPDKGPFKYLSPLPGTDWVSPETKLAFRHKNANAHGNWMSAVTVAGSISGPREGHWIAARDGETFIFDPEGSFAPGERVDVVLGKGNSGRFGYSFSIAPRMERDTESGLCSCVAEALAGEEMPDGIGRPVAASRMTAAGYELPTDFPEISILTNDRPAPGSLFLANFTAGNAAGSARGYLIILGNDGSPAFFRPAPAGRAWDFKVQPDGRLSFFRNNGKYLLMDDTYTVVDSVWAQNYEGTDAHDLQVLPNGNYLVIGTQRIPVDMSELVEGGNPDAMIVNMIIQEQDDDNNVVFEWRSWDHFSPLDAIGYNLTGARVDYVHTNSVELDSDGGIIMSHRHMDEITKVSRETGDIVWRMGGKNNDFTLIGDDQWFTHQHSARRLPGGNLTVFDNGNNSTPTESRAIEYEVDEVNMTATRVWEYRHDPPIYGRAMGNTQRQPNGNTVINWGLGQPNVIEVRPDGSTAFELTYPERVFNYRAFRFEWHGVAARPDLWATVHDNTLALNFMKFGDESVVAYNVYRSDDTEAWGMAQTVAGNRMVVHDYDAGQTLRFRVTALDGAGVESPFSNEVTVTPEFGNRLVDATVVVTPRVLNEASEGNWIQARVDFVDGCGCFASDSVTAVRLNDAVDAERVTLRRERGEVVGLKIKFPRGEVIDLLDPGDEVEIWVSGRIGENEFIATDAIRVIGSDTGGPPTEKGHGEGGDGDDGVHAPVALRSVVPNPFNPTTLIRYAVASPGQRVTIEVFDVAGKRVRTLVDGPSSAGDSSVTWDGRDDAGRPLSSGVYFCRLTSAGVSRTGKMVLMK